MVYPALLPLMRTPRLPVVDWTDAPRRFKRTRPFRRKMKSGFCACAITFQLTFTAHVASKLYETAEHRVRVWRLRGVWRVWTQSKGVAIEGCVEGVGPASFVNLIYNCSYCCYQDRTRGHNPWPKRLVTAPVWGNLRPRKRWNADISVRV